MENGDHLFAFIGQNSVCLDLMTMMMLMMMMTTTITMMTTR